MKILNFVGELLIPNLYILLKTKFLVHYYDKICTCIFSVLRDA